MQNNTFSSIAFALAATLLLTHELDAVMFHEWRVLPLTSFLSDDLGYVSFLLGHIPLFFLMFWILSAGSELLRQRLMLIISGFCIVHAGLHWWFSSDPAYEFEGWISTSLIAGAAVAGTAYLLFAVRSTD